MQSGNTGIVRNFQNDLALLYKYKIDAADPLFIDAIYSLVTKVGRYRNNQAILDWAIWIVGTAKSRKTRAEIHSNKEPVPDYSIPY